MCLENYPECGDGGDGCCLLHLNVSRSLAERAGKLPRIYARRLDFQLYAVWMERNGTRVADCVEACCAVCAKADFIGEHVLVDKAEAELNRMYALPDRRADRRRTM
jgi:hypothetical protein